MKTHRLSLSRYWLALLCSYWARPDVDVDEDPPGEAAQIGTGTHRLAELLAKDLPSEGDPILEELSPHVLAESLRIFNGPLRTWVEDWKRLPGERWAELRLRYDARSDAVREVPRRGEPGYSRPGSTEVTGELDFVRIHDRVAELEDLKTGDPRNVHDAQLHAYGLLISRFADVDKVRVRFLFAKKTKLTFSSWQEMDVDRLDLEAGRIGRTLRRLPTADATPPEDEDVCRWRCPLKRNCPAWVRRDEGPLEASGFFG